MPFWRESAQKLQAVQLANGSELQLALDQLREYTDRQLHAPQLCVDGGVKSDGDCCSAALTSCRAIKTKWLPGTRSTLTRPRDHNTAMEIGGVGSHVCQLCYKWRALEHLHHSRDEYHPIDFAIELVD